MIRRGTVWAAVAALAWSVASLGLAEKDAQFTARSDVRMNIEGARGTSMVRVQAMAQKLGGPLGKLKSCYGKLMERRPKVTGTVEVQVVHPKKGRTRLGAIPKGTDRGLSRCIRHAFEGLRFGDDVPRPAAAALQLEFTNTVADAADVVEERQAQVSQVTLERDDQGRFTSQYRTGKGELGIEVKGRKAETVVAAHRSMARAIPRLLDCRRRAGKNNSPEGELHFAIQLRGRRKPRVKGLKSTVPNSWALPCSKGAIRRARFEPGAGRVRVTVHFGK